MSARARLDASRRGVTYDAGMLIAADRDDRSAWALHQRLLRVGAPVVVPAVVLAQAWRGGPQASLSRLLSACRLEPISVAEARLAGAACAKAGTHDVIDALVVVGALRRGDLVVTSDPQDLTRVAAALGAELALERV